MELQTERLLIRYCREDDLDQYAKIVADADVMRFLDGPQTKAVALEYLQEMIEHHKNTGLGRYAVLLKSDDTLVGICGFRPADMYIDFGYRYARSVWGQGVGLEAALAVREYGLNDIGLVNIETVVAVENVASLRIAEKMNFKYREETELNGESVVRFRDRMPAELAGRTR